MKNDELGISEYYFQVNMSLFYSLIWY